MFIIIQLTIIQLTKCISIINHILCMDKNKTDILFTCRKHLAGSFTLNAMLTSCNDPVRLKAIKIFNLLVRFCTKLVSPRLVNADLR